MADKKINVAIIGSGFWRGVYPDLSGPSHTPICTRSASAREDKLNRSG